ncbi:MAG: TolC family protein [Campylobacterota bacterium]
MSRFLNFFSLVFIVTFASAQEYKVDILVDKNIDKYINEFKQETKSVFFRDDSINFNIKTCKLNCKNFLDNKFDIAVFQASKKQKHKETYLINYNKIQSSYDKNRVIKAFSLAVFEYLKESKKDSIFLKSVEIFSLKKEETRKKKSLNLKDLATFIKKNSYEYKQNKNSLDLDFLDIKQAQSSFKPKLSAFSNYVQIDEDRAKASKGQAVQKQLTAGIKVKQLLYSNEALKNIKIKKLLHKASKQDIKAVNERLLYESILIYLNIIQVKEQLEIINKKRDFIQKNMLFSKQRVQIGVANRSDIYRWESEFANANIRFSTTKQKLQELKYELFNKLGLKDSYDFINYDMKTSLFKLLSKDAIKYIQNPRVQKLFFKFVVQEHPWLKKLQETVLAKKEQVAMNKESYYSPKLAFEGNYKKYLSKEGEAANIPVPFDDREFEAVVNLSFDLYNSSLKDIKLQRSKIEYLNLKISYNKTEDLIAKNLKTNYYFLQKSYENISYSKNSLHSSKKNLEYLQDRYNNKKANIIELLDAQNTYSIAQANYNISVNKYLQNLVSIYFFIGKIELLVNENIKYELENRINEILKGD